MFVIPDDDLFNHNLGYYERKNQFYYNGFIIDDNDDDDRVSTIYSTDTINSSKQHPIDSDNDEESKYCCGLSKFNQYIKRLANFSFNFTVKFLLLLF